jgi:UDP-N-acetylmuramoyl-L-alanyl-D-glutamate--2,6-diaminopimelate ligase
VLRSSVRDHTADCAASLHAQSIHSTQFTLRGPWGEIESQTSLIGAHNVSNVLQACAACHAVGVSGQSIADAIASAEAPPGRLEAVTTPAHPFTVLVDYSHTDGALDTVLRELRPLVPRGGKMRTLFGCGGDRDRTKRPRMAQAALRHSDEITITSDNPRHESPTAIIDQILVGVPADMRDRVIVEADRRAAIGLAIMNCRPGDVLLIAGKGHETSQIIGNESRPFDDRVVAREALGNVELGMPIT